VSEIRVRPEARPFFGDCLAGEPATDDEEAPLRAAVGYWRPRTDSGPLLPVRTGGWLPTSDGRLATTLPARLRWLVRASLPVIGKSRSPIGCWRDEIASRLDDRLKGIHGKRLRGDSEAAPLTDGRGTVEEDLGLLDEQGHVAGRNQHDGHLHPLPADELLLEMVAVAASGWMRVRRGGGQSRVQGRCTHSRSRRSAPAHHVRGAAACGMIWVAATAVGWWWLSTLRRWSDRGRVVVWSPTRSTPWKLTRLERAGAESGEGAARCAARSPRPSIDWRRGPPLAGRASAVGLPTLCRLRDDMHRDLLERLLEGRRGDTFRVEPAPHLGRVCP
jgi:hypothetical protein